MPVTKQLVPIDLTGGLNTKTDPKSLQPGQLEDLRNAVYRKGNRLDKRPGYDQLPNTETIFGEAIDGGADGIATYQDELLMYAGQRLYSYAQGSAGWVDKGPMVSAIIKTRQIIKNSYEQSEGDMAISGSIALYAWQDSDGQVRYSIEDISTGTIIVNDEDSGVAADVLRCAALGQYLYLFIRSAANIKALRFHILEPAIEDMGNIVTDLGAADAWDTSTIGTDENIVLFYRDTTPELQFVQFDQDLTMLAQTLAFVETADICSVEVDDLYQIWMGWGRAGTVRMARANRSATLLDGPTEAEAVTATHIVLAPDSAATGACTICYSIAGGTTDNNYTRAADYLLGVVSGAADLLRSVSLQSKSFEQGGERYVQVIYSPVSGLQTTWFIVRVSDGLVVGKQLYREAFQKVRPSSVTPVGNAYHWLITNRTRLISEGDSAPFSSSGQAHTLFDFGNVNVFNTEEMGRSLFIAGGIMQQYDGAQVTEFGFPLFPEPVTVALGAAGVNTPGIHFIKAVYEWTDANGQIQYSAPSLQKSVTVTGGSESIDVTVGTLRVTTRGDITVAIFMTEASGELFYRVSSVTSPVLNDPTADTVAYNIDIADADIIDNDLLYTTGGVLENTQPPACAYLEAFKGRLMIAGLENPLAYWYSKINQEGVPIEFTDTFSDVVESKSGDITAVSTLDDKFIIWKRDRPYYIFGDGPNSTGGGSFTLPTQINIDVGCSEHTSIVRMPDGLMFKSVKGIYTLTSGFGVSYVGAGVEDGNALLVTGAVLNPDTNEVRYVTNGRALVYNYFFQRWSTFTNFEAKGAVNWINTFAYIREDGTVFLENDNTYKDAGATVSLGLKTGWISLAGLQGFLRVCRFAILGTYKSRHILRIKVGYDFEESWRDYYIFDTEAQMSPTTFGTASPFGEVTGAGFGGNSLSYFFRAHLSRQKCSAIRFSIEDVTTEETGESGEGLDITGLALEVGLKGKIARRPYLKSIGAS